MRTGEEDGDERAADPGVEGGPLRGRQADAETLIRELFAEGGPLCEVMPGYGRRPEQEAFALEALRRLSRGGVLLADVPTGTGKSMGYLAAAVLSGKRAAVSTATIALQGQLLGEDLPVLRRAVALLLGYPPDEGFTFAVMKGRPNFLCDQRLQDTLSAGSILDGALLADLERWGAVTSTGDREDLDFPVPVSAWLEVASDGEDCAGKACSYREKCHYYAHRDRATEADVLVVNHALLVANAATFGNIFSAEGRHLVIDEAHRLEGVMSEAFGRRFSYGRVRYAMRQARKKSEAATPHAYRAEMAADLFFDELREKGRPEDLGSERAAPRSYKTLADELFSVREALLHDPKQEANALTGMVGRLRADLVSFYSAPEPTHAYAVVAGKGTSGKRWRDGPRKAYPELRSWLVDTDEAFAEDVLPVFEDGGVVLCSATLAESGGRASAQGGVQGGARYRSAEQSFAYVRRRLGLEGEATADGREVAEHSGGEIFDYAERCLVYVGTGIREPSYGTAASPPRGSPDDYALACARRSEELVRMSGGRALILLSTSRAVGAFRESFRSPYPVRFQGEDSPGRLVRWLKESEGGVLVGTRGFWEGISVPGEAVSLVILDRVPFVPPGDPVFEALKERAGKAWFREVALPRACVAVRQGAGRLMRTPTDRGVVAILDPRLTSRSWGASVLRSLPPAPVTRDLSDVRRFFGAPSPPAAG